MRSSWTGLGARPDRAMSLLLKTRAACLQNRMALADAHPHLRDLSITFEAGPHVYTINGDSDYTSVTTWLHSNFEKFDADAVASRLIAKGPKPGTKYHGMTKQAIMASWRANGREASAAGTALHENIERFYNGEEVDPDVKAADDYQLFERFQGANARLKPYRTEWMIWDAELRLAGSIDMIFDNDDGTLSIYDWKRCKDIRANSPWNKFSHTECISHIPDTNYWHYALQLNVYAALLEKNYGKTIKDLRLVVLHPNQTFPVVVSLPWLRDEVAALFASRAEGLRNK